jgi:bla regulator protein BlaR1
MNVVSHLWQSTLFAAAAGLVALTLRNNRASTRFWVWFTASIKFLIPFAVLHALGEKIAWQPTPAIVRADFTFVIETLELPFFHSLWSGILSTSVLPVFSAIWFSGCAAVLFVWSTRKRRLALTIRDGSAVSSGRELEILRRLEQKSGFHTPTPLLSIDVPVEPGVLGIVSPLLLWPHHMSARLDDSQVEAILAHELCHLRRRDNLLGSLHMMVQAIFWFHPLVWWLGARLVHERELACDEAVIDAGSEPRVYAESILKTCEWCLESRLLSVAGVTGSDLTQRIWRIMRSPGGEKLTPLKKAFLALMVALAIVTPFLIGACQKSRQSSDDADKTAVLVDPQPRDVGGPYRPGNGVESPSLTHEVKPQYTAAAMKARIQGSVLLECVVRADGTVGDITVTRSLDAVHGLDQAAIDAARQWRFKPGTRQGKPVPVLVTIEIAFTLK